jgi:hypothetical protein
MGNLAVGFFEPDPSATTLPYRQDAYSLVLEGNGTAGGTIGGLFSETQDWSGVSKLGLRVRVSEETQNSFFSVELYSGENLEVAAVFWGTTAAAVDKGVITNMEMWTEEPPSTALSDIRGFQFTWSGDGSPANLSIQNFVDLSPLSEEDKQVADKTASLLSSGSKWEELSESQKYAYANTYPEPAVSLAGTLALNLIRPSLLTEKLVTGHVNHAGVWKIPYFSGGSVNPSNLMSYSGYWPGWGRSFPVVQTGNPLHPSKEVGSVSLIPVVSSGRLIGYYYMASQLSITNGITFSGSRSSYGTGYSSVTFGGTGLSVIRPW